MRRGFCALKSSICLGGEGAVVGGASNSDQITDTTGAQKTSSAAAPVTMATMMMGGREEMVATPNGSTPSTPPTNDSLVMHATYVMQNALYGPRCSKFVCVLQIML
jgi:hypothetical protein